MVETGRLSVGPNGDGSADLDARVADHVANHVAGRLRTYLDAIATATGTATATDFMALPARPAPRHRRPGGLSWTSASPESMAGRAICRCALAFTCRR